MDTVYGSVADSAPEGFLRRRAHFTTLVRLDEGTMEGVVSRKILAAGFGTRSLPLTIGGLGPGRGHMDEVPVGRLDKVAISGHNVEGWGWLADDEMGRQAYHELLLQTMRGNSVELADVKMTIDFDWGEDDEGLSVNVVFTNANLGATTLVMRPAFAAAGAELEEEITASLAMEGDLEVTASFELHISEQVEELVARTGIVMPHSAFTVPEPDHEQIITISRDGKFVSGHLGNWRECHTGWVDRCVRIPRSRTNYASYCKSPIPTDKGTAYVGPIFLLGGHDTTRAAIEKAVGNVENVWADVVVVDGKFGPWACGVIRPGVTDEALYAARASRISGHWLHGELFAICSVSGEGFNVKRATKYVVETDARNEVEYLAASFAMGCEDCEEEASFAGFGPHSTATVKGTWDAGAQEKNVTSPNTLAYFGRIYAWRKPDATATDGKYAKTDMGFPHHMVSSDGTPGAANLTGCSAGIGRLNQGNGGPDRQAIYNHLASHLRAGGQEPPKLLEAGDLSEERCAPEEVAAVLAAVAQAMEVNDDVQPGRGDLHGDS